MNTPRFSFWAIISRDFRATNLTIARAIFNSPFRAVLAYRIYSHVYINYSKALGYILYQRCIRRYGFDVAPTATIGPGLHISHLGAIVVGRNVVLGENATLNSCVTLGMKDSSDTSMPRCGANLNVGTGAKLLGGVVIGNDVIVGANSVVLKDVPSGTVVAGVPARTISTIRKK